MVLLEPFSWLVSSEARRRAVSSQDAPLFTCDMLDIVVTGAVNAGSIQGAGSRDPIRSLFFRNVTFLEPPKHGWGCEHVNQLNAVDVVPNITCSSSSSLFNKPWLDRLGEDSESVSEV
jgi:hypothetical protein